MEEIQKNELNILFLKDIVGYLDGENIKYFVVPKDEETYHVNPFPPVFNGHLSAVREYLCYDYDLLMPLNQQRYARDFISLHKKEDEKDIFSVQTKHYVMDRNLFT